MRGKGSYRLHPELFTWGKGKEGDDDEDLYEKGKCCRYQKQAFVKWENIMLEY